MLVEREWFTKDPIVRQERKLVKNSCKSCKVIIEVEVIKPKRFKYRWRCPICGYENKVYQLRYILYR